MIFALFSGCNNLNGNFNKKINDGNGTYLKINVASVSNEVSALNSARGTSLPVFTVNSVSDYTFTIQGKGPNDSELKPLESVTKKTSGETTTYTTNTTGEFTSLSTLKAARFPIQTGEWTFKLTASKNGTVFSDQITKTITTGSIILDFNLKWEDTNLDVTQKGSLSFTLDFSNAPTKSQVTRATTELQKYNSSTETYETVVSETTADLNIDDSKVNYASSDLYSGNYKLIVRLYAYNLPNDGNILLYTWIENAIINAAQESTGLRKIHNLNELYTINWHNLEVEEVSYNLNAIKGSYSRFSETYTLPVNTDPENPEISRPGYIFEGWFEDEECIASPVTSIPQGSSGSKDFYAKWTEIPYAKVGSTMCGNKSETMNAISSATDTVTIVLGSGVSATDLGNAGTNDTIAKAIKDNTTAAGFELVIPAYANIALDLDHGTLWQNLFGGCTKLNSADLRGLDTTNATSLSFMFNGCTLLSEVKLSSLNTSKVTMMKSAFKDCSHLIELDLSSFDTSNVTSMETMFSGCTMLKTIKVGASFDTSSVSTSTSMFGEDSASYCSVLVGGKGTEFNSSKVDKTYARADRGTTSPGYFTRDFLGTKMAPDSVGDIVFNDGTAEAYQENMTLTDKQKAGAVAVIFKMETQDSSGDIESNRTLGLGIKNSNGDTTKKTYSWAASDAELHNQKFTGDMDIRAHDYIFDCEVFPVYQTPDDKYISGDLNGSNNWSIIQSIAGDANTNYPVFNYANNYASKAGLTGTRYANNWYIPTVPELICMNSYKETLNTILSLLDGDTLEDETYWSSNRWYTDNSDYETAQAYSLNLANNSWPEDGAYDDAAEYRVCVIREF